MIRRDVWVSRYFVVLLLAMVTGCQTVAPPPTVPVLPGPPAPALPVLRMHPTGPATLARIRAGQFPGIILGATADGGAIALIPAVALSPTADTVPIQVLSSPQPHPMTGRVLRISPELGLVVVAVPQAPPALPRLRQEMTAVGEPVTTLDPPVTGLVAANRSIAPQQPPLRIDLDHPANGSVLPPGTALADAQERLLAVLATPHADADGLWSFHPLMPLCDRLGITLP